MGEGQLRRTIGAPKRHHAQEQGEPTPHMQCQIGPLQRTRRSAVEHQIFVARKERIANIGARVDRVNLLKIRLIDPSGKPANQQIIEGRLAAFLFPRIFALSMLHRQPVTLGHMAYKGIMIDFVWRFKGGHNQAVPNPKPHEEQQNSPHSQAFGLARQGSMA